MSAKHSKLPRGLTQEGVNFNGTSLFGRLFPHLPSASYGATRDEAFGNLSRLAGAMISPFDAPKDGPDDEESGIPALYTYFGQFIDHDLTFDPNASFQKQKDLDAKEDFRTAAFDLDNVYGRGPDDQPYIYDNDGKSFLLGDPLTLGADGARDLQRNGNGRALIGDPRNDENAIVSQLQGLFLRFHNRVVAENPKLEFKEVQKIVRYHYQYLVVNDFLPRIVTPSVLEALKTDSKYDAAKLKAFQVSHNPRMPVEFSAAAYRIGHSMIRPGYRLNDANLIAIFPVIFSDTDPAPSGALRFPEGLTGFRKLVSNWGLDWGRFIDIDIRAYQGPKSKCDEVHCFSRSLEDFNRLQFAYRLDTALVHPLGGLPQSVAPSKPSPSLPLRNLLRGLEFGLPNGQEVARFFNETPLKDKDIGIGQGTKGAKLPSITHVAGDVFAENCPLWTYVLAEAILHQQHIPIPVKENIKIWTPQLGPVGGRIVAEVFLGLLFSDSHSFLHHNWQPKNPGFLLKDFVTYALGLPGSSI